MNEMPPAPLSRADLESTKGLCAVILQLPSDPEVPRGTQGYNRYTTQRAHWLGWLGLTPGTGTYQRAPEERAGKIYNRIGEPKMLLWLIAAAGIDPSLALRAKLAASEVTALSSQCKAIRQIVPYSVVAEALWSNHAAWTANATDAPHDA